MCLDVERDHEMLENNVELYDSMRHDDDDDSALAFSIFTYTWYIRGLWRALMRCLKTV